MTIINKDGMLIDPKVKLKRFKGIEHGILSAVNAIVVHQTDTPNANIHLMGIYRAEMALIF